MRLKQDSKMFKNNKDEMKPVFEEPQGESIMDVVDTFCKIFDNDYVGGQILNDLKPQKIQFKEKEKKVAGVGGIKRKRIVGHKNVSVIYMPL